MLRATRASTERYSRAYAARQQLRIWWNGLRDLFITSARPERAANADRRAGGLFKVTNAGIGRPVTPFAG